MGAVEQDYRGAGGLVVGLVDVDVGVVDVEGGVLLAFDGGFSQATYTFSQNLSISGMGWGEAGFNFGVLRASGDTAVFSGNIVLTGNAGLYTQFGTAGAIKITGAISDGGWF